jgi:hypothetical protein
MTEEKQERMKKDMEVIAKVVEENREGLSKLAKEDEAKRKRDRGIKNYLRRIKRHFKEEKAETVEIKV